MKMLVIDWKDRLDDLYNIASATGQDAEACECDWFSFWLPDQRKDYDDVTITPIPDKKMKEFEEYANS